MANDIRFLLMLPFRIRVDAIAFFLVAWAAFAFPQVAFAQDGDDVAKKEPEAGAKKSDKIPQDPEHEVSSRALRAFGEPEREPPVAALLLIDELKRINETKIDISAERKAIAEDRRGLLKLQAEIAEARTSLKVESARLQEIIDNTETGPEREKAAESRAQMAKAMQKMPPKKLATLLVKLERSVAIELLRQMKPKEAVALLEQLPPEQAAEFAAQLLAARGGGKK